MNPTVAKWQKTRLLGRIDESNWELAANTLEAQVQYNEEELGDNEDTVQFKRISVPLVVRAFAAHPTQTNSLQLPSQINMKTEATVNKDDIVWYPTNINMIEWKEQCTDGNNHHNLDKEAELVALAALKVKEALKTVANFGEPEEAVYFYGVGLDENFNICVRYRLGK